MKNKIDEIPKTELRSQTINNMHRQEFVVEFTRSIFLDRVVAATPADMGDWKADIDTQVKLLRDAFPLLKKPELREVYGTRRSIHNTVTWEHNNFNNALRTIDGCRMAVALLKCDRLQEGVQGRARGFSRELCDRMKAKMPNVKASEDYLNEMHEASNKISNTSTEEEINAVYIYLPKDVRRVQDLMTEKKVQDPKTGVVTRTPMMKQQYADMIPKAAQARILTWLKKKRATVSTEALQAEMSLMFEFSRELYEGVRIIRNTKQFQERLPDMFDDFCFITGLGQANGQDLICGTTMSTVQSILLQTKIK